MLIDCDACAMRGPGCADCVVTVVLGSPADDAGDRRRGAGGVGGVGAVRSGPAATAGARGGTLDPEEPEPPGCRVPGAPRGGRRPADAHPPSQPSQSGWRGGLRRSRIGHYCCALVVCRRRSTGLARQHAESGTGAEAGVRRSRRGRHLSRKGPTRQCPSAGCTAPSSRFRRNRRSITDRAHTLRVRPNADPKPTLQQAREQVASCATRPRRQVRRRTTCVDDIATAQRRVGGRTRPASPSSASRLNGIRSQIGALAVANYQQAGMTTTAQLLLSTDPDQFLSQASTARAFAGQQNAVLHAVPGRAGQVRRPGGRGATELNALNAVRAKQAG